TCLHELGHLLLDKNRDHYCDIPDAPKEPDVTFYPYNALIDAIINYKLSININIPRFYNLFLVNRLNFIRENKNRLHDINTRPHKVLGDYCYNYTFWKYILRNEDKEQNNLVNLYLERFKYKICDHFNLNDNNFRDFEKSLDNFQKIKDSNDLNQIYCFILRVYYVLNSWGKIQFWDKET
ncbi:unnamed protein product, partial [marine sediment metagenome]